MNDQPLPYVVLLTCCISYHDCFSDIFVKDNKYKLGDFGLAKSLSNPKNVEEGDPRYMAKELLDWGNCDDLSKADIFSFGLTMYELLSGIKLPANGPLWHDLRNGRAPARLDYLHSFVESMMEPDYRIRPSAARLLRQIDQKIAA